MGKWKTRIGAFMMASGGVLMVLGLISLGMTGNLSVAIGVGFFVFIWGLILL